MRFKIISSLLDRLKVHVPDRVGMIRQTEWDYFVLSQNSDVYEGNFSYTVRKNKENGEYYFYLNDEEKGKKLKTQTVDELIGMDLSELPDEKTEKADDEPMMLDGTTTTFLVFSECFGLQRKVLAGEKREKIISLLSLYK